MYYYVYLIVSLSNKRKLISYVGYTNNLKKRLTLHNTGKGAKFTRGSYWKIIYKKQYKTKSMAIYNEYMLKSIKPGTNKTYAGYSSDVEKRLLKHNNNKGAKSTRGYKWKLVFKKKKRYRSGLSSHVPSAGRLRLREFLIDSSLPRIKRRWPITGSRPAVIFRRGGAAGPGAGAAWLPPVAQQAPR